jgi:hypothetical protein
MKTWVSIALLAWFIAQTGAAPLGTAFTYQGRLGDGGVAANGSYDLTLKLYDAATNGTQVGATADLRGQGVTNGLFTVTLDFGAAAFAGDARWLDIAVRSSGGSAYTTLTPRQPLTATPYALYALTPAGATGATSAQGPKGDKGDTGATGPQGLQGSTGPKGDKGDPAFTNWVTANIPDYRLWFGQEYLSPWFACLRSNQTALVVFDGDSTTATYGSLNPVLYTRDVLFGRSCAYPKLVTQNWGVGGRSTWQWSTSAELTNYVAESPTTNGASVTSLQSQTTVTATAVLATNLTAAGTVRIMMPTNTTAGLIPGMLCISNGIVTIYTAPQ